MADIELIVKIPEESYNILKNGYFICPGVRSGKTILQQFCRAIYNGTPLPKGHRKLIVEPTDDDIAETIGGQNDFAECIREAVRAVFDNATAIVEADTESAEGVTI